MIEAKQVGANCVVCVFLACLSGTWLHADGLRADPNAPASESDVVIELTRFEITPETLEICYDMRNDSNDDVWVCTDIDHHAHIDFAMCLSEDGRTLGVLRRPDLPPGGPDPSRTSTVALPAYTAVRLDTRCCRLICRSSPRVS